MHSRNLLDTTPVKPGLDSGLHGEEAYIGAI